MRCNNIRWCKQPVYTLDQTMAFGESLKAWLAYLDVGHCLANDGEFLDDLNTKIARGREGGELVTQHVTNGEVCVGHV